MEGAEGVLLAHNIQLQHHHLTRRACAYLGRASHWVAHGWGSVASTWRRAVIQWLGRVGLWRWRVRLQGLGVHPVCDGGQQTDNIRLLLCLARRGWANYNHLCMCGRVELLEMAQQIETASSHH